MAGHLVRCCLHHGLVEGQAISAIGVVEENSVCKIDSRGVGSERGQSQLGRMIVNMVIYLLRSDRQLGSTRLVGSARLVLQLDHQVATLNSRGALHLQLVAQLLVA